MGVVHLAHRDDLSFPVAIKFLRDAWMSPARAQRFSAEQKTLAQLNHPFIARLYDADTLPDGTPWFAMEYVEGISITDYCERQACSIEQRLALFRSVCEAVQYAHTRAVIHRDLKPSNILVKPDGTVRLLDFGIAKHLEATGAPVDQTRTELRLFTPAYAAPEQIRGEPAGVFTDVYALGVILYELLAGCLPGSALEKPSLAGSKRLPASHADWTDLDVLCLTAMHGDIERRYRSVEALIRDVDRFLHRQPLDSRPDTLRYRAGKFIARNRRAVAAAAAIFVVISCLTTYFTVRLTAARGIAASAASRTERVQKFMLNLFDGGDRSAGPAEDLRVVTLVDRGVKEADSLSSEPAVQAEVYRTLGNIYQRLGKFDRADSLLHSALEKRKQFAASGNEIADSLVALGLLRVEQAKLKEGERLIRAGLEKAERSSPRDEKVLAEATAALGKAIAAQGSYRQAIPLLEKAIRIQPGPVSPELAASVRDLAHVHFYLGNYDLCETFTRRAMDMHIRLFGDHHPAIADDLVDLGYVQQQRAHYKESERFFRRALAINQAWYGADHPETASNLETVSQSLSAQKRLYEAQALLERALAIQERAYGPVHPRVAIILNQLALVASARNRYDEAEQRFTRAIGIYRSAFGENSSQLAIALANLGSVYLNRKEYSRAEAVFRDVIARDTAALSAGHFNTGIAQIKLGNALVKQSRFAEAEPHSLAGYNILSKQTDPSNGWLKSARKDLVAIYKAAGQAEKARRYEQR